MGRKRSHIGEADDGQADGAAAEALHDAPRAVDKAQPGRHIARQQHLRPHPQLHRCLALRRQAALSRCCISLKENANPYTPV